MNIFAENSFRSLKPDVQILQFARLTHQLNYKKDFDVVFAYDWMTYLAATELKLSSGKKLVLQVNSVSQERGGSDCQGWVYEIEKQTFEKADALIVANSRMAAMLATDYGISPDKINIPGEETLYEELDLDELFKDGYLQQLEEKAPNVVAEFLEIISLIHTQSQEKVVQLNEKANEKRILLQISPEYKMSWAS
jgi:hypothetical protein